MSIPATTAQTVGPFFKIGLSRLNRQEMAPPGVSGERITIMGRVLDGDGVGVPDALLEIWQANAQGKYAHPEDTQAKPCESGFLGYGRIPTGANGEYRFTTIKPGRVPGPDGGEQAPHLVVSVFMRGLLRRLVTRIYFAEDAQNERDCILNLVERERRATLMAKKTPAAGVLEWNVVLQGPEETVFFEL